MIRGMSAEDILKSAFARHAQVFDSTTNILDTAGKAGELIAEALQSGKKVLACGNGGSAADAEHFIGELVCRYKDERRALPGISLVSNAAALTAIANDYSFEDVFARQISALGQAGDILVAISTSGKSKNVLAALRAARQQKMSTVLLTGQKGTSLGNIADVVVVVPSEETARIQEMHELIYHGWCEFLDTQSL